jgi:hypothetical protein
VWTPVDSRRNPEFLLSWLLEASLWPLTDEPGVFMPRVVIDVLRAPDKLLANASALKLRGRAGDRGVLSELSGFEDPKVDLGV